MTYHVCSAKKCYTVHTYNRETTEYDSEFNDLDLCPQCLLKHIVNRETTEYYSDFSCSPLNDDWDD